MTSIRFDGNGRDLAIEHLQDVEPILQWNHEARRDQLQLDPDRLAAVGAEVGAVGEEVVVQLMVVGGVGVAHDDGHGAGVSLAGEEAVVDAVVVAGERQPLGVTGEALVDVDHGHALGHAERLEHTGVHLAHGADGLAAQHDLGLAAGVQTGHGVHGGAQLGAAGAQVLLLRSALLEPLEGRLGCETLRGEQLHHLFARGLKVTSRDVANLVRAALDEHPMVTPSIVEAVVRE